MLTNLIHSRRMAVTARAVGECYWPCQRVCLWGFGGGEVVVGVGGGGLVVGVWWWGLGGNGLQTSDVMEDPHAGCHSEESIGCIQNRQTRCLWMTIPLLVMH